MREVSLLAREENAAVMLGQVVLQPAELEEEEDVVVVVVTAAAAAAVVVAAAACCNVQHTV